MTRVSECGISTASLSNRFLKRRFAVVIFISAAVVRSLLAYIAYNPRYVYTGEAEWIAKSIALHGTFAGAYAVPTGPTAHCGPFYPSLLSVLYYLLGAGSTAEIARIALLILVNSLVCGMLPFVALILGLPLECGVLAGLAAALIPMHRTAELFHAWDEPYAALGLMAVLCLFVRWTPLAKQKLSAILAYGALWGFLLHISPPMLLAFGGLSFMSILVQRQTWTLEIRSWFIVWSVAGLILLPWTLRNRVELGGWIFVRSNFGIELQMSNNDRSGPTTSDNRAAGLYRDTHPSINVAEAEKVRTMGEIAYNHARFERALDWIRLHPVRFAALTLTRIRIFWTGSWEDPETAWLFALGTIFALVGGWMMWRDGRSTAVYVLSTVWISYPLTYYFVQQVPRYRVPIWWTVLLSAAYGPSRVLSSLAYRKKIPLTTAFQDPWRFVKRITT